MRAQIGFLLIPTSPTKSSRCKVLICLTLQFVGMLIMTSKDVQSLFDSYIPFPPNSPLTDLLILFYTTIYLYKQSASSYHHLSEVLSIPYILNESHSYHSRTSFSLRNLATVHEQNMHTLMYVHVNIE